MSRLIQRWKRSRRTVRLRHLCRKAETLVLRDRNAGFFSLFLQTVGAADICRQLGIRLVLNYSLAPYFDASRENASWWQDYFQFPETRGSSRLSEYRIISDNRDLWDFASHGAALPRIRAHSLVKTFHTRSEITEEVNRFAAAHFGQRPLIGIHYRGTDKVDGDAKEANRVSYRRVRDLLYTLDDPTLRYFVATDEEPFLKFMLDHFSPRVAFSEAARSLDGNALHTGGHPGSGYDLGRESLVDSLLLARTKFLLRTDSNLSKASLLFNPELPEWNLTRNSSPIPINTLRAALGRV